MRYELLVAVRYLARSRLQTALTFTGVALGILVYTFMAALINGLQASLTEDVIGNIPHVTLEPEDRVPRVLNDPPGARVLAALQRVGEPRQSIAEWRRITEMAASMDGVIGISPEVNGGGFARRGQIIAPIGLVGVLPDNIDVISNVTEHLVSGDTRLGPNDIVLGTTLAEDLGLWIGHKVVVTSELGVTRTMMVRGIFDLGSQEINERLAFVNLATGQHLLALEGRVSQIRLKVWEIYRADEMATRMAAATGLHATSWIGTYPRFRQALSGQRRTGALIKLFSMLIIVLSVASVLLLSAVRRQAEIGIMRSMGVPRSSIIAIFVLQGALIGLLGSSLGALLGWVFCELLVSITRRPDGTALLPVDPALGEYGSAILFASIASALAAILPARQAANVDPVEVIQT